MHVYLVDKKQFPNLQNCSQHLIIIGFIWINIRVYETTDEFVNNCWQALAKQHTILNDKAEKIQNL